MPGRPDHELVRNNSLQDTESVIFASRKDVHRILLAQPIDCTMNESILV